MSAFQFPLGPVAAPGAGNNRPQTLANPTCEILFLPLQALSDEPHPSFRSALRLFCDPMAEIDDFEQAGKAIDLH